jgi:outer membrane lipoprotein-sorting protein
MKTVTRLSIAFAILIACAFAQAPGLPQFSADMTMTSQRQPEPMKGKIFFDKGNMRMDMNTQRGEMSLIRDNNAKTNYMLMHERKMYIETKDGARPMGRGPKPPDVKAYDPNNPCAGEEGVTCKKVGEETINGRDCDKWEFTSTDASKNRTVWVDKKIHIPIKTVSAESTTEFSNIQEGPQDKSHFEVPSDYQKFDPSQMMGGGRGPGL